MINDKLTKELQEQITENKNDIANIIESGSNAYGNYIKYSDGTMICYGEQNVSGATSDWYNTLTLHSEDKTITFPKTFIDSSYNITFTPHTFGCCGIIARNRNIDKCKLRGFSYKNATTLSLDVFYIAIGRWKN
ncbi:MAG: hypothetical protein IJI43_01685 [Bacilli bacterium]|nr:hypothetical protein [Bacilli bacterium]